MEARWPPPLAKRAQLATHPPSRRPHPHNRCIRQCGTLSRDRLDVRFHLQRPPKQTFPFRPSSVEMLTVSNALKLVMLKFFWPPA
jgi:hypothetical protein